MHCANCHYGMRVIYDYPSLDVNYLYRETHYTCNNDGCCHNKTHLHINNYYYDNEKNLYIKNSNKELIFFQFEIGGRYNHPEYEVYCNRKKNQLYVLKLSTRPYEIIYRSKYIPFKFEDDFRFYHNILNKLL